MSKKLDKKLEEVILETLEHIKTLDPGSREHSAAVEDLVKLHKMQMDEIKREQDRDDRAKQRELDEQHHTDEMDLKHRQLDIEKSTKDRQIDTDVAQNERDESLKRDQLTEQVKDRKFKVALEAGGIVLPLLFYGIWMKRGFKFEETGTYTSKTFMSLFNKFKTTRK